ncbi:MAG: DedA family protein [Proteobacteria bacterium]|nr:DedA family protein [Pseudomonadota bacterium]
MDILPTLFTTPSLPLLFVLSFMAATILPIGSEWLLIVMVLQGFSLHNVIIIATLGNFLGACTTYLIGIWGAGFFIRSILRIDDTQLVRAKNIYGKYGAWSLLLSWLPVIGDPLCLVAGVFRISFIRFSVLVFVGKFSRYAILAFLARHGTGG